MSDATTDLIAEARELFRGREEITKRVVYRLADALEAAHDAMLAERNDREAHVRLAETLAQLTKEAETRAGAAEARERQLQAALREIQSIARRPKEHGVLDQHHYWRVTRDVLETARATLAAVPSSPQEEPCRHDSPEDRGWLASGYRQPGERWTCKCGAVFEHFCTEDEGCSWEPVSPSSEPTPQPDADDFLDWMENGPDTLDEVQEWARSAVPAVRALQQWGTPTEASDA